MQLSQTIKAHLPVLTEHCCTSTKGTNNELKPLLRHQATGPKITWHNGGTSGGKINVLVQLMYYKSKALRQHAENIMMSGNSAY